jgi:hypothetical protein
MSDPSKPIVDAPLISITLERPILRAGVGLITAVTLLIIGGLGIASSPIVDGHPVVLSPERLAIKTYLDTAGGWLHRFTEIDRQLAVLERPPAISSATVPTATVITASPIVTGVALVITVLPAIPLPTLAPPSSWPSNLYDRAQQADRLVADLAALDADQQNSEVPPALNALHTLARSTLQAFARWSTAALDVIGAPTPDNVNALQGSREAAQAALAEFRRALETQQQETH